MRGPPRPRGWVHEQSPGCFPAAWTPFRSPGDLSCLTLGCWVWFGEDVLGGYGGAAVFGTYFGGEILGEGFFVRRRWRGEGFAGEGVSPPSQPEGDGELRGLLGMMMLASLGLNGLRLIASRLSLPGTSRGIRRGRMMGSAAALGLGWIRCKAGVSSTPIGVRSWGGEAARDAGVAARPRSPRIAAVNGRCGLGLSAVCCGRRGRCGRLRPRCSLE